MEKDLYQLKNELELNTCHLSDVADAKAELTRQWDELQLVREGLIKQIVEKKHQ